MIRWRTVLVAATLTATAALPSAQAPAPSAEAAALADRVFAVDSDTVRRAAIDGQSASALKATASELNRRGLGFRRAGDLDAAARAFLAAKLVA